MKQKSYLIPLTSLYSALVLILFLSSAVFSQETPKPLGDDEFKQIIASSKTTDWEKIKIMTDDQAEEILNSKVVQARAGILEDASYGLWLKGLDTLTDKQAKTLSENEGFLNFDGLKTMTEEVAKQLSRYKGFYVPHTYLDDEKYMSRVGSSAGGILSLNGLDSLTAEQAKWLGKAKTFELCLNGLTSLTDAGAKSLSYLVGPILLLDGVTTLSDKQAKSLAQYSGKISFAKLDKTSRELFQKYGGAIYGEK